MRNILIVGAGQAGLQLGLCLLANDYQVTLISSRTPAQIRGGRVTSTQVLFGPALELERRHGLNLWEPQAPSIAGIRVSIIDAPGRPALQFAGALDDHAQSVDQRVKMAGWLELFERCGGKVLYLDAAPSDLERLCRRYELTIVAAGKGALSGLFERDEHRSPFDRPQRALSCIYVNGVTPLRAERGEHVGMGEHVGINVVPDVGEVFSIPACTTSGPCHVALWEAVPDGPFDCWRDRPGPREHLQRMLALMRAYLPWEHERFKNAEPADALCVLAGGYPPTVRRPVAQLSATSLVLGMGDAVVLNDPIAGQGANNAAHCAEIYLRSILEHGERAFDAAWMQNTFDAYWDYARHATSLSNALLGPIPAHIQRALAVAAVNGTVARRFARGYAEPADFAKWILDPSPCDAYLASVARPSAA